MRLRVGYARVNPNDPKRAENPLTACGADGRGCSGLGGHSGRRRDAQAVWAGWSAVLSPSSPARVDFVGGVFGRTARATTANHTPRQRPHHQHRPQAWPGENHTSPRFHTRKEPDRKHWKPIDGRRAVFARARVSVTRLARASPRCHLTAAQEQHHHRDVKLLWHISLSGRLTATVSLVARGLCLPVHGSCPPR